MYKIVIDMVYRYQAECDSYQLVGILGAGQSINEFLNANKEAFI